MADFYKYKDSQTVYNQQNQGLDYNSYISQGGRPDFSNVSVLDQPVPTLLSGTGTTPQAAPQPASLAPTATALTPTPAQPVAQAQPGTQGAQTDINKLIGQRPSSADPKVTEFYNTQTGQGFTNPQQLSEFINQQVGSSATTPEDVFTNIQKGFQNALASGKDAPQEPGAARSALKALTPPIPPSSASIEQQLAQDPGYQQLLADRAEYNNVVNQGKSLLDTYNQMTKDAGIPAINTELVNTQKILDGTEDDIRNEVKAASGFATESQVMSLASSRNKQLIKNYNALLATKQMAMESINTMVNLASQDRQFALQSIEQKMQIDQQIMQYRDKFVQNAKEGYQNVINAVGYQGLFDMLKDDPNSLALAERTLGMGEGQLQNISSYIQQKNNLAKFADYNITSRYVDVNGEIQDTQTGQAFSTPEEFFAASGVRSFEEATKKGLVKPLGITREQEQQQFENQIDLEKLGIDKARFGLEQDKFGLEAYKLGQPGKIDTQVVDLGNGRKALVDSQTGEIIREIGAGETVASPQQQAQSKDKIDQINSLLGNKNFFNAVAPATRDGSGLFSLNPAGWNLKDLVTGEKSNFISAVETLRSQLTLDALKNAKAGGATFGALSEGELRLLEQSATQIGKWAVKDKSGNIVGYKTTEEQFRKELDKINNFAKQDYILKGGNPADVGTQVTSDGQYWTKNSDGTMTNLVIPSQPYGPSSPFKPAGKPQASNTGMRTDRHNNPAAFTTDVAKTAGLVLGKDYEIGDPFPNNPNLKTARLLGDPVDQTIKVIDRIGFYTQSGKPRWSYVSSLKGASNWQGLSYDQKKNVVKQMYAHEGGSALNQYFA